MPTPLIIVASWYPGVDDPGRGRFVADQAEALHATGRVRPLVASFELAPFDKDLAARPEYLALAQRRLERSLEGRSDAISPQAYEGHLGVPISRLPVAEPTGGRPLDSGLDAENRIAALQSLAAQLSRGSRGVVHAHTGYPDGAAAVSLSRELGWPLVVTEHASFVARIMRNPAKRRGYLAAVRHASRFIAVSEVLAGELRAAIPELESKLVVVPNAIPIDDFTPVGLEGRHTDELLFVGYRKERKGMVVLLNAFADVLEQRPGATLRLIGRSSTEAEEDRWHELARELGIAEAVTFDGPTDRDGVAAAMVRTSVFVHASPRETFGIATLEALASGTPVVATRSGGISHVLEDRRLGELVPPQDSRALARAVLRTLERRTEFDPAHLRAAVEPFAARTVAGRLADMYDEILGETPQTSDAPAPWQPAAQPLGNVILVAYDTRRAAAVLRTAPRDLLGRITLLTRGDIGVDELPEGIGRTITAAAEVASELRRLGVQGPRGGLRNRLLRLLRNPLGPILRRLARGGLAELRWQAARAGMLAALRRSGALDADRGAELVSLDGLDYVISEPLLASGAVRAVPGGALWLADRWASAQADEKPSRSRIADASRSPTTAQS
jgi:glycogen(starch) synthase